MRDFLFEFFSYFSSDFDRWFQNFSTNCPFCRASSSRICCHKLQCFNFSYQLVTISTKWPRSDFDSTTHSVRVNDKCSASRSSIGLRFQPKLYEKKLNLSKSQKLLHPYRQIFLSRPPNPLILLDKQM